MLNKCTFIGNLGRDPEVRTMQNGGKVANLSLGVTEKWTKDGEKKEKTEWVRIVIFGKVAEIAEKYCHKGSKIYISGAMQTRKWSDKDGVEKFTTEVVLQPFNGELILLDGRKGGEAPNDKPVADRGRATQPTDDDDIPW